ncbi:TPA: DUF2913 family protein [Klebsiella quasipneumoniae subsp. similipneumoniae]|nr:DUF2913 family protein [Klebsiella quasipneumoniae subsp. similipneumoniae]
MERYRHISYCALVALGIHRKYNGDMSFLQENIILLRWFKGALQKRCFAPSFTPYIEKLISLTNNNMSTSSMKCKLEAFYKFSEPEKVVLRDYFRFYSAIEELRLSGINHFNLSASRLKAELASFTSVGIFTEKNAFRNFFSPGGILLSPARLIIVGVNDTILGAFSKQRFELISEAGNNILWSLYSKGGA